MNKYKEELLRGISLDDDSEYQYDVGQNPTSDKNYQFYIPYKYNLRFSQQNMNGVKATAKFGAKNILHTTGELLDLGERPNQYQNIGNVSQAIVSSGAKLTVELYKVDDFERCAQYYHRNGYLVNEYVNSHVNIFDYVNTRYYYNVLKLKECDVHLNDTIESQELVTLIKNRLTHGLRLWNVMDNGIEISNFTYDNVEKDFLTT